MTTPDRLALTLALALFMLLQALVPGRGDLKANKPISHALHGLYRAAAIVALWAFFWHWKALVLGCAESLAVFAELLNRVRGKPFGYIGKDAWLDRIERSIAGSKVWVLHVIYLVIWIILLIKL